ncbi:MAG TPA: NYN domain-containing protein [Sphingomonas sp.]|uniref:NYN domain-containing protein n=1 Tax=Sphingomonas sp. TaxID=28214 RepID=UPI002ED9D7CA
MRLAVLIDADNASPNVIGPLLSEVAALGTAVVKRIYGDFTMQNLAGWRNPLMEHAIQPIQQFRNTIGKNASDSALIIDAMDLLHQGSLDGFCLVTSDSDFTRLATRIRENGLTVFGFGEKKTPKPFITACDRFIYTELFRQKGAAAAAVASAPAAAVSKPAKAPRTRVTEPEPEVAEPVAATAQTLKSPADFRPALDEAFDAVIGDDKRVPLGVVGTQIQKLMPDFDPRNYGMRKLSDLVENENGYDILREKVATGGDRLYVERVSATPVRRSR